MGATAIAVAAGLLALAWHVFAVDGWSAWEGMSFLCLLLFVPWLGLSAATALAGILVRLLAPDPAALVLPGLRGPPPDVDVAALRLVVAVCVRLEDMDTVLPPLARLLTALRAAVDEQTAFSSTPHVEPDPRATTGIGDVALGILSDTPDGPQAVAEAAAVTAFTAGYPDGVVLYRRRSRNDGYKAGNVMDFLDRNAARFDVMLLLDADSRMSSSAVRRMLAVMAADPALAILQPTFAGVGARTLLARIATVGTRHGARIWATGQAWWQGPCGPFWGHNALMRIAPFRAHCRLDPLPDGAAILSHDHVEAARLHAAGWAVRVWPDDLGSGERHPPDLIALFRRDIRWAEGNLQYRHLLRRPELGRIGRFQMLQAILHYALAPLFFALLPLAAINTATGHGAGTPRGALLALVGMGWGTLLLPKLAGYAESLLRQRARGRRLTLLRRMGVEALLAMLIDPIAMLERSAAVLRLVTGYRGGWTPQAREARGISWSLAARRFGAHTAIGLVLLGGFAAAGLFPLLVSLPFTAGLVLAIPLCVLTGRPVDVRRSAIWRGTNRQGAGGRRAISEPADLSGVSSPRVTSAMKT